MHAFLYDTWAFVALANRADPHHALAVEADRRLEADGYVGITTDYVLDETLTGLHLAAGAQVSLTFADLLLTRIQSDDILFVEVTSARRERALTVFRRIAPQEDRISFTDCTSFAVMHELGVELAFTADRHFHRAGKKIRPILDRRGSLLHLAL